MVVHRMLPGALLAAGLGSFALGFLALLNEISAPVHDFLPWVQAVGPLSGKVFLALIVWAVAWIGLHVILARRSVRLNLWALAAAALDGLGILFMFPPFWGLFVSEGRFRSHLCDARAIGTAWPRSMPSPITRSGVRFAGLSNPRIRTAPGDLATELMKRPPTR